MSGVEVGLLRHFPTDWNRARRLQGRTDRPLTAEARAALAALAPPPPWDVARAIASPLARAHDTAAALWPAFETDARLAELDYGAWEGRSIDALLGDPGSGYVPFDRWGRDRRAPGGESPRDAWARVEPLLAEIAAEGRRTVFVTHRGLMRAILGVAHGWDYDRPEPFAIKRGRLHVVTLDAASAPAPGPTIRLIAR